jgi:hypothetical protein
MAAVQHLRRVIAIVLAFATLVPLILPRLAPSRFGGGGGTDGDIEITYTYGDLPLSGHLLDTALALAIAVGAAAVWAARDRRPLIVGVLVGAAGLALTPMAIDRMRSDRLTPAADRAIHEGMSRDEVRAIAGRPAGSGEAERPSGERLSCLVYFGAAPEPRAFCFAGERLVEKR